MFSSRSLLLSLTIFALLFGSNAIIELPEGVSIPAIFVFGDSTVDAGNNNDLATLIKANFPPYGRDFVGGVPTGRFCDGRVPSDLIAEDLSIKKIVPAYLDPKLEPQDLPTGVNFASSAAGYDPLTSQSASVIPLTQQLNYFKEYTEKLKVSVGEDRANTILANSLYLVVAGADDIVHTYFGFHTRQLQYSVSSYTDLMLQFASSFLKSLYDSGARRVAVFSVPAVGCIPTARTAAGGIQRDCASEYNNAAILFNTKLSAELDSINSNLPNSKMVYIDTYNPLLDIIQQPQKYGLEVADKGCCGTGNTEAGMFCNKLGPVCEDVSKYVFWDSYHPTENTYKILFTGILSKYIPKLT